MCPWKKCFCSAQHIQAQPLCTYIWTSYHDYRALVFSCTSAGVETQFTKFCVWRLRQHRTWCVGFLHQHLCSWKPLPYAIMSLLQQETLVPCNGHKWLAAASTQDSQCGQPTQKGLYHVHTCSTWRNTHVMSHQSYLGCAAVSRRHYQHFLQKTSSLFGRAVRYIPSPQRGEGPVGDEPEEVRVHCTRVGSLCMKKCRAMWSHRQG